MFKSFVINNITKKFKSKPFKEEKSLEEQVINKIYSYLRHKVFSKVTKLEINGCGDLTINKNGLISGCRSVEKIGKLLKILVGGKRQMTNINGVPITVNSTSSVRITNRKGNISVINGLNNIYWNQFWNNSIINNQSLIDEDQEDDTKNYIRNSLINSVTINGPSDVNIDSEYLHYSLYVKSCGSGNFKIPNNSVFDVLNLELNGSGDISGGTTNNLYVYLCGSGDIKNITINNHGTLSLRGSGDICVRKKSGAFIKKSISGNGSIKIRNV